MTSHRTCCGYPYRSSASRPGKNDLVRDANAALFNIAWEFFWPLLCVPNDGFALDIAAGTGWASYLLSTHRRVIAIDIDYDVLSGICQQVGKGISPIVADGRHLPLAAESVDLIFMNSGYHHIEDRLGAWDEWYRVLKPGGRLVATGETPMENEEAVRQMNAVRQAEGAPCHEYSYTKAELALALEKASAKFTLAKYIHIKYQENMQYLGNEQLVVGEEERSNGIILAIK